MGVKYFGKFHSFGALNFWGINVWGVNPSKLITPNYIEPTIWTQRILNLQQNSLTLNLFLNNQKYLPDPKKIVPSKLKQSEPFQKILTPKNYHPQTFVLQIVANRRLALSSYQLERWSHTALSDVATVPLRNGESWPCCCQFPTLVTHNCFVPDLLILFILLSEICNDTNQCHSCANNNCSD